MQTSPAPKQFCFITIGFRSASTIERCLKAIEAQTYEDHEVVWWDNEPLSDEIATIRARHPMPVHVSAGENLGFAAGNNRAAELTQSEWLVLINPDAFAAPDFLEKIAAAIEVYPDVSIFGALQTDAQDETRLDGAGDGLTAFGFPFRMGFGHPDSESPLRPMEVFSACGAALVIKRALFVKLGGFDEDFFTYCEDADLGFRARLLGERILLIPEARVLHVGSASLGVRSDFALYHGYRNRLWLFVKNAPPLMLWLGVFPHIFLTLVLAIKDMLGGHGPTVMRALKDAIAGLGPIWQKRKAIQATRKIGSLRLAKLLAWNPILIFTRAIIYKD